jgi:hypothetical protein
MSLNNRMIAISISDAPDRDRLGYPKQEVDRVLLSVCTALVRAGARIVYGGNLDPSGFTFKIFRHLAEAFAVRGPKPPFVHVVPEPVLRRADFDDLANLLKEAEGTVETTAVLAEGRSIGLRPWSETVRDKEGDKEVRMIKVTADHISGAELKLRSKEKFQDWLGPPKSSPSEAYKVARVAMTRMVSGRVVMGGKMGLTDKPADQYEGRYPGVIEEAILALGEHQPLVTLGAFGGAARDLAIALELMDKSAKVPRGPQVPSYFAALEEVRSLNDRIPPPAKDVLSQIASDDRAEPLSYAIVRVLERWQPTA